MKRNSNYIMTKIIDVEKRAKAAQIGVDLTLRRVLSFRGDGFLSEDGKMQLPNMAELPVNAIQGIVGWYLNPGAYPVEFDQGLKTLAGDENAYIIQRSSLNRGGVRIESSIYDPGFHTDWLGATMFVFRPIIIAQHARVAQLTIETNEPVPVQLQYDGTWQGKATF